MAMTAAILLALAPSHAAAEPRGEIIDYGITAGRRVAGTPGPGEAGLAPASEMKNIRYLDRTDRIEARLCRNFGLSLRLSDDIPKVLPRQVSVRVEHPTLTRPDGRTSAEDRFESAVIDGVSHVGFTFEHAWEMAAGDWTIIVSIRGREIARKAFTITLPPPGAPDSDCGVG
jgi:hypothetical protein